MQCKKGSRVNDSKYKNLVNTKMLASDLYKSASTLQHFDFVLLSKRIAIMLKSPVDFAKLKMFRVLVYLLKYNFQFLITEYL